MEPRDNPNPSPEPTDLFAAVRSCAGICPGSNQISPITCEGACSTFSTWLLSQHPDPALRSIFLRARARRSLGAAIVFFGAVVSLGCASRSSAAEGAKANAAYELKVAAPPVVKTGELATASIRVLPKKPYKINLEFPLKLKLSGPAGAVSPGELSLGVKQATKLNKDELLLKPGFKLLKGGSHAIKGTLRFSVCTDAQCEIKQEAVSFTSAAK